MKAPLRHAVTKNPVREALKRLSPALLLVSLTIGLEVTGAMTFLAPSAGLDAAIAATAGGAQADKPDDADAGDEDDDDAKIRQPVRVGDLIGRDVIAPVESQDLLGHVKTVVQTGDDPTVVMTYGGHFGFGTHLVCVSADALALTGYAIQAKGISKAELDKLPDCDGAPGKPLAESAMIKMKLAKPAH